MMFPSLKAFTRSAGVVCLIAATAAIAIAERLPQTVRPEHYNLKLAPDLKAATFTGSETIDLDIQQPTSTIVLNVADIEFQSVSIKAGGKEQAGKAAIDNDREEATFTFPQQIPAGKASLSIDYKGILNDKLRGFYLSKTPKRNYAVTQFESTDARRAFPSFDEPAFKANYDVTLVIDKGDTAISNSLIKSDTPGPGDGKHTLTFDTTPRMSTYLVAFLVGDFQCTGGEQDGVKIRVCSTPDKVDMTGFGVEEAKKYLHYYNNYFGIPYPLKKLDLIGLPDFEAGAMENFGAITYRETALLIDPKTATIGSKKNVAEVIAHEMAHQWFGDLVTMQWWDNIWLNEGFATWMENKPVAALHPDWNIDQDVAANLDSTLNLDAQPTTRAIRAKADTREEIEQMFDGISYGKAGAVLLMVENYLGEETFRKGVHNYLAAHLYGNATAEDFWNAQTATSHKPVDKIMESLVAQPGAPIFTFGEPQNGKVEVSQKRFFLTPSIKADQSQKWTLPVCFKTSSGQQCEVLTPEMTSLKVPADKLFFANAGGKGYYRVSYPDKQYNDIVANVETGIKPTERVAFLGGEWAQVRADKATVGDYLNLVTAVKDDESAAVVDTAVAGVAAIMDRVAGNQQEKDGMAAWLRTTFSPVYAKLGPPEAGDSPDKKQLRSLLFGLLGTRAKDPAVIEEARSIAPKFIADPTSVDPEMGQTAVAIAARNGDEQLFDKLADTYQNAKNPRIASGALYMLGMFESPELSRKALDFAASDKVRKQDAMFVYAVALQNDATRATTWKYVKDNWGTIQNLLTPELGGALAGSTSAFCSADARDDVKQFFSTHKIPSGDQAVKHAIERINGCIELRSQQEPNLQKWLQQQGNATRGL
jgi:aminopeptidase N/puromycin-sensitive aminopeptidase